MTHTLIQVANIIPFHLEVVANIRKYDVLLCQSRKWQYTHYHCSRSNTKVSDNSLMSFKWKFFFFVSNASKQLIWFVDRSSIFLCPIFHYACIFQNAICSFKVSTLLASWSFHFTKPIPVVIRFIFREIFPLTPTALYEFTQKSFFQIRIYNSHSSISFTENIWIAILRCLTHKKRLNRQYGCCSYFHYHLPI